MKLNPIHSTLAQALLAHCGIACHRSHRTDAYALYRDPTRYRELIHTTQNLDWFITNVCHRLPDTLYGRAALLAMCHALGILSIDSAHNDIRERSLHELIALSRGVIYAVRDEGRKGTQGHRLEFLEAI